MLQTVTADPQAGADPSFQSINRGFNETFRPGRLSVGLVVPLEAYPNTLAPKMDRHLERAQLADRLGFAALWLRDVPFNVPSFGDAGQMFDPFVYLGLLAGTTERVALATGSIILPLRHPAHVAKAAASADVLSGGRVILGVASGDRPQEYPAMNMRFEDRGARFRDSLAYIRHMAEPYAEFDADQGSPRAMDMLPKPTGGRLPCLITGGSRQSPDWGAAHGDGWITYPRPVAAQAQAVADYRARVAAAGEPDKPVSQSLYIDLVSDDETPRPIHLGFRAGVGYLTEYLDSVRESGVNHVALNLRFNGADIEDTLHRLAVEVLPRFHG